MNLSYWEYKTWLSNIDFTIVGSGIVGLNCALQLRKQYPTAKIMILEKGILPQGASTKNAGFACFGSLSEILDDLRTHSEQEVLELVKRRCDGLNLLRENLGDARIDFQQLGGYELFTQEDSSLYEMCLAKKETINQLLKPIFRDNVFSEVSNIFQFEQIQSNYIFNQFEGQLDTGKMMHSLLQKVLSNNIQILNSVTVENFSESGDSVHIQTNHVDFHTKKLLIATNGFASQLLNEKVKPARAQVLITKPIPNLHIKVTFHLDKGYYYFRNIDDCILFGGGRNLDFTGEETTEFEQTELIQQQLEKLLKTTILPNIPFEIAHRWSGIMGVGSQKKAIIKPLSDRVFCGVRLGGMGVAIGSLVGKELAELT